MLNSRQRKQRFGTRRGHVRLLLQASIILPLERNRDGGMIPKGHRPSFGLNERYRFNNLSDLLAQGS